MDIQFVTENRIYETTYIIRPDLEEGLYKTIRQKFDQYITDNGGKILNQEIWGIQKLAYEIEGKTSGFYVFTEMDAPAELIHELEREYQYDERIIRYLTVKLDKYGQEYAERRRERLANQRRQQKADV